jgi:hypothetical protein
VVANKKQMLNYQGFQAISFVFDLFLPTRDSRIPVILTVMMASPRPEAVK